MKGGEMPMVAPKSSARITIPNKAKDKPNFPIKEFEVGGNITIHLSGIVKLLRHDEYDKTVEIEPTKIEVYGGKNTLSAIIERSKKGLK